MATHSSQDFSLSNVWQVLRATCAFFLSYIIASQINSKLVIKSKGLQLDTPRWGCLSKSSVMFVLLLGPFNTLCKASSYVFHIYKEKNSGKWVIFTVHFAQEKGYHISLLMLSCYSIFAACGTSQAAVLRGFFFSFWLPIPSLQVLFLLC